MQFIKIQTYNDVSFERCGPVIINFNAIKCVVPNFHNPKYSVIVMGFEEEEKSLVIKVTVDDFWKFWNKVIDENNIGLFEYEI